MQATIVAVVEFSLVLLVIAEVEFLLDHNEHSVSPASISTVAAGTGSRRRPGEVRCELEGWIRVVVDLYT